MEYKIIVDSSADIIKLNKVPLELAPLKIITDSKEYIDGEDLDVKEMVLYLNGYSGKSSTCCPSVSDWLERFGEAKYIFCITISSNLSGSFNSAILAKQEYESAHPESKVFVIDSLSAGAELKLIAEKLEELILKGEKFEEICKAIKQYQKSTGVLFMLESLKNLANNGRVGTTASKIAGLLGIRVIGKGSEVGTLEMLEKARGEKKAIKELINCLAKEGYKGGKIRITHCLNEPLAQMIATVVKGEFGAGDVEIYKTAGLCSFYAEKGGIIIGFEKN